MTSRLAFQFILFFLALVYICCSREPLAVHKAADRSRSAEARSKYSSPESLAKITGLRVPPDLPQIVSRANALSSRIVLSAKVAAGSSQLRAALEHPDYCDPSASTVDFRALGLTSPVKDQGQCGACWAFATNAVLESSYLSLRKERVTGSEQELISCSSAGSCSGGWWAFDFLLKPGIESSSSYGYEGNDSACKMPLSTEFRALSTGYVTTDVDHAQSAVPNIAELKTALCKHGPLAVAFRATPEFIAFGWDHHDAESVFAENDAGPVNHGIVIAGWNDSKQAWIIKNSWGSDWGENGFLRVKYGSNSIGLGAAWAEAWPKDYAPPARVRTVLTLMPKTMK